MKYVVIIVAIGLCAGASAAMAQAPTCNGAYEVVRNIVVKPGKKELFLKAVQDHQAWYTAHGLKDRIILGRVLAHDADSSGFSSSLAMTVHTDLSQMAPPAHAPDDAAWNRYIAEYKESSDVTNMTVVCLESLTR
jgi:hypothetical protein